MKSLLCILVVSLSFHNCKTEKRTLLDKFLESAAFLSLIDGYLWVNVCPPKNATLTQGIHTITLNEGEEYWFDVNTDSTPLNDYLILYKIGIVESSGQTLSVGNPSTCILNGQIFNPYKIKAEGRNPEGYENGFNIYIVSFRGSLVGIKSKSGLGEIQIKVP
ncbi:MAG: hypothetical protein H7A23_20710 [Leptospiraceae bacterium]|nr:hypothetical protein [Leptospiraceae bacterium]